MKKKLPFRFLAPVLLGIVTLILVASIDGFSQTTKGDRPASEKRSIFRLPKFKSKQKGGDRPYRGELARRLNLRTPKSWSARAIKSRPLPFANRKPSGDKQGKRLQTQTPIRSNTARMSRNNVYPSTGPYVNNPSPRPRDTQGTRFKNVTRPRIRSKTAQMSRRNLYTTNWPYVNNPSPKPKDTQGRFTGGGGGFGNFFSRVVRQPFFGRGAPSASGNFVKRGRKNVYWGKFSKGEKPFMKDITGRLLRAKNYHTPFLGIIPQKDPYRGRKLTGDRAAVSGGAPKFSARAQRPWKGSISGNRLRRSRPRDTQRPGTLEFFYKIPLVGKAFGNRPLPSAGIRQSKRSKFFSKHIQNRVPGTGGLAYEKYQGRFNGKRPVLGGGSVSGRMFNNKGRPIQGKVPLYTRDIGKYSGNLKGRSFWNVFMFAKPGGSVSGRALNNKGRPIQVRAPRYARDIGLFAGNVKSRRAPKGGGSISGRSRNNNGVPVAVRLPLFAKDIGAYRGNYRRGPKAFDQSATYFQGFDKTRRPPKGGGSISGRPRNNKFQPIQGREPRYGFDVGAFSGNIKAKRPEKGGGSVSGKLWNNNNKAIAVRIPGIGARKVDTYKGSVKTSVFGLKQYDQKGLDYQGNIKGPRKATHGGGSISGKLWNNKEKPIKGRPIEKVDEAGARYRGELRLARFKKNYVKNPNAKDLALKKQRPDKTTYMVDGLQIRAKEPSHAKRSTSAKLAIDVHYPGKAIARLKDYQGNQRMSKPRGKDLHPDAQFAHNKLNNVKRERTIFVNVKLMWAKLFRKTSTQPRSVKEKIRKPRYDKKEKELWKDLYD